MAWQEREALKMLLQVRSPAYGVSAFFRRAKLKATFAPGRGRGRGCVRYLEGCPGQGWGLLTLGRDLLPAPPCVLAQDRG